MPGDAPIPRSRGNVHIAPAGAIPIEMAPKDGTEVVVWARRLNYGSGEIRELVRWRPFIASWSSDFDGWECYWRASLPGIIMRIDAEYFTPIEPPKEPV